MTGQCGGVTERQMENGRKETPYIELGLRTQKAPQTMQVQRGAVGGCEPGRLFSLKRVTPSRGLTLSWHQQSLPCGNALLVLPNLPFLQLKSKIQICYEKSLNSLMWAINF